MLGADVTIEEFAYIGRVPMSTAANRRVPTPGGHVTIGARCAIGPYAVIYTGVAIGPDCLIGDHASIREGTTIGARCVISRHVTVNYACFIGDDVRIMDNTHITGGMSIGDGSFLGVGVVTSNDRRVDVRDYRYRPDRVRGPVIGHGVVIGSGANILAGVTIGDGAVIGAGSIVTKDVPACTTVMGKAARVVGKAWAF
jgi:acetyltransferase-like isoleucine patch superfamily enzyme